MPLPSPSLPPILFRWLDEKQARSLICGADLSPTWTHLMPDTRRLEKAICFGEDAWRWKQEHEYSVCVALETAGFPDGLNPIKIDGEMTFKATCQWKSLQRSARAEADPKRKTSLLMEARSLASRLKEWHEAGKGDVNEWVLRGSVPNACDHILGLVVLDNADYHLKRLLREMTADGSITYPVKSVTYMVDYDPKLLEREMKAAFEPILADRRFQSPEVVG